MKPWLRCHRMLRPSKMVGCLDLGGNDQLRDGIPSTCELVCGILGRSRGDLVFAIFSARPEDGKDSPRNCGSSHLFSWFCPSQFLQPIPSGFVLVAQTGRRRFPDHASLLVQLGWIARTSWWKHHVQALLNLEPQFFVKRNCRHCALEHDGFAVL